MPQQAWSAKRERQYEHVKDEPEGARARPRTRRRRSPRAPSTRSGRARARRGSRRGSPARTSRPAAAAGSGPGRDEPKGRTRDQLYEEAKDLGIEGRSKMTKEQLQRAVDGGSGSRVRSYPRGMRPRTLDHVALWVADRDAHGGSRASSSSACA